MSRKKKVRTKNQEKQNIAFGSKIRTIREELGLTLTWLSSVTGLHEPNLSKIENGRGNPTLDSITAILEALGITFPGFFTYHVR